MSPSFVKPPSPPKRKPSNLGLTIKTPAMMNPLPQQIKLSIPATPSIGRPGTLRHFQSSPSLPLFPMFGGDSVAEATNLFQSTTLETILSPTEGPQIQAKVDEEQNFDVPLSKEEKPEAYPDGPICVHEPYIDLYLEPTAEQARHYDVVLNVAVEVRNPLDPLAEPKSPEPEIRLDGGGGIQYAPKREKGFQEQRQPSSPTTPKATASSLQNSAQSASGAVLKDPEYIHIPWEHNSDIVPDLLRLVKLIDERVAEKKRVLVHCQCGVSRSASLVVAYGLYKDRSLSVQEAYDAVKARSKWIGPNMVRIPTFQAQMAANVFPRTSSCNCKNSDQVSPEVACFQKIVVFRQSLQDLRLASGMVRSLHVRQMQDHPHRLCLLDLRVCIGRFPTPTRCLPLVLDHRRLLLVCRGRKTTPSKASDREP